MHAETRLTAILQRLEVLVFEVDREGILRLSEGGGPRAFGLHEGEVGARSIHDYFAEAPWALDGFRRALAGEAVAADGRLGGRSLHLQLSPGLDPEGRVHSLLGILHEVSQRTQLEDRARSSERRLQLLIERGPLVVYSQDLRSGHDEVEVSANVTAMLGYQPEELDRRTLWRERMHPEDTARLDRARSSLLELGTYSEEFRFRHKDGGWRWLLAETTVVRDAAGKPEEMHGFLVDVTERRAARAYAAQSIGFESRVIAAAEIGIIVFDAQLRYRVWNPYIARLLGIDADEVVGRTPWQVFAELGRGHLKRDLKRALCGAVTSGVRVMQNRMSGENVTVAATLAPMQASDGELLGVVLLLRDITEQRRLQEAYESSERSFRALIDDAPDGMLVQRDGKVVYANRSLLALLGYDAASEVIGRAMLDLVRPDQHELAVRRLVHTDGAPFAASQDYVFLARGGREVPIELRSTLITFDSQPSLLAICRDQTERLALQAQLMASDRLSSMGALAAGVGHEINNPLAAILANLESGLRDLAQLQLGLVPGFEAALEPLRDARDAAVRLKDIARDLKLFSRAEDDRVGPVDLPQLMDSTLRLAQNEIKHRAQLRKDYGPVPRVLANESRLGQVFLNLVINATQAIPEGRVVDHEIVVTLRTDEKSNAVVEVRDTGSGIAPELLKRIFDPFFTTKPAGVGTGLGLAICQRLVAAAGGSISAESELGRGSLFRVVLPGADDLENTGEHRAVRATIPPAPTRGTVLVVDDDATVARSIARTLKRWHDVVVETDAASALRRLRAGERFDMILCDIMMPAMTGMDFHGLVAQFAPEVADQIVFMSGGVFSHAAREFLDRVPNTLVEKPFDPAALHLLIEERVRQGRA